MDHHANKKKRDRRDLIISILFLLPAITVCCVFIIYPVIDTAALSFNKWNGMFGVAWEWVGM